jgi:hypothetical protein
LHAASFGGTSLTRIADPDKAILSWRQNAATPHVCVAAHRMSGFAPDPENGWASDKSGTKMIFPGLPKDEDIDNVIAYLKQFGAVGKKS